MFKLILNLHSCLGVHASYNNGFYYLSPILRNATKTFSYTYLIPCSNLMHHFFITFITFLYMFRATLWSSSGGFIVYIQHLVLCMSLFLGDRSLEDLHRTHPITYTQTLQHIIIIMPCITMLSYCLKLRI